MREPTVIEGKDNVYITLPFKEKMTINKFAYICKNGNISLKEYWRNQIRKCVGVVTEIIGNKAKIMTQGYYVE